MAMTAPAQRAPRIDTSVPSSPLQGETSALEPISPWPPAEPEEPDALQKEQLPSAKEVYGSLAVLLTYFAFALYLVWGFAPRGWLDKAGWTWYPDREWALIVPCWIMVGFLVSYFGYINLTIYMIPPFDSITTIRDGYSNLHDEEYYYKFADPTTVPEAIDIPLDLVNRVLYPPPSPTSS